MYVPSRFREDDRDRQLAFMRQHGFALVISAPASGPVATHLPVTVTVDGGDVMIRGHFAKANRHWRALGAGETLVVFSGPHAYVSPQHYDAVESVPTWNYLAVHAYGTGRTIHEPEENLRLLRELIGVHERSYWARWQELPERYRQGMLGGIVGFEVKVARIEGKAKLSQNKSEDEQWRIAASLRESADPVSRALAEEMERRLGEPVAAEGSGEDTAIRAGGDSP